LSARCGVVLDEWQEVVLQAGLGERTDGRWAASQVAVSAPRQQGKSQLIVARALAGILLFNERTIIISAHQQDTAREVFTRLVDILQDIPSLDERVEIYSRALNREYIRFKSGQVIRFKARSVGSGRGFSCDCLLLDEAQILGSGAWRAILPTMSARPNPQVWLFGTPPTAVDDGEVFTRFRQAGLEGKESRVAYLEWSAAPGDDFDDPQTWAKANPSFGTRISHDAVADERATMSDDEFALERLGMWEDPSTNRVIDAVSWGLCADVLSQPTDAFALAVDVAPDRSVASVAFAGLRPDGLWHVELDAQSNGVAWVAARVADRCARNKIRAVVVDGSSPGASVVDELLRRRIKVTLTQAREVAQSFGSFYDGVVDGSLRHIDQPQLNAALAVARKRELMGGSAWSRKNAASDITPIVACTLALWGAQASRVKRPGGRDGVGRSGTVM
jgi:phage terminase large subunit-like protein